MSLQTITRVLHTRRAKEYRSTALDTRENTKTIRVQVGANILRIRTIPEHIDIPIALLNDESLQLSLEDSVLCGTTGELALRLLAAITNTVECKTQKEIEEQAKLVFTGYKVWSFYVWKPTRYDKLQNRKICTARDVFDTVASTYAVDNLLKNIPLNTQVLEGGRFNLKTSIDPLTAVWIALDGSACGIGLTPEMFACLDAAHLGRPVVVFDTSQWLNAGKVLETLVFLTPSEMSEPCMISTQPYLDLKVGAFDPLIYDGILKGATIQNSVVESLKVSKSPREFVEYLLGARDLPKPKKYKAFDDEDLVFAEVPSEDPVNPIVCIGTFKSVVDIFGVDDLKFAKLDHLKVYLLFGPPLHLFAPFSLFTQEGYTCLRDICRIYPEAPHLATPAQLERQEESAKHARDLLGELVGTEWAISTTQDTPKAHHRVPVRVPGKIPAYEGV